MFGGPVGTDGLAYLDARPSAASEFDMVPSHLQPLVVMLYWARYFGGCECLAAWWVQMAWHILMQGHLHLLSLIWCQAIYNLWLSCCIGPGILEVVNVWRPGRCRWLDIS